MTQQTEGHFYTKDSTQISFQSWSPPEPTGTLVVTHGLAEHSECYSSFAKKLNEAGWQVFAWDLRGHGKSEGARGLVLDFNDFCTDLIEFLSLVQKKKASETPLVAFGHSLGGLITLRTAVQGGLSDVHSICLSSPALGISMPVPKIKDAGSRLLSRFLPKLTLNNEINYRMLTRDPKMAKDYERDNLRHDKISPRLYLGMLESFDLVFEKSDEVTHPLLLQLAGQDHIVSTQKSLDFFDQLNSSSKEKKVYPHSYHEIFNDLDQDQVYNDLIQFLKKEMNS